jgi:hypothetical protein
MPSDEPKTLGQHVDETVEELAETDHGNRVEPIQELISDVDGRSDDMETHVGVTNEFVGKSERMIRGVQSLLQGIVGPEVAPPDELAAGDEMRKRNLNTALLTGAHRYHRNFIRGVQEILDGLHGTNVTPEQVLDAVLTYCESVAVTDSAESTSSRFLGWLQSDDDASGARDALLRVLEAEDDEEFEEPYGDFIREAQNQDEVAFPQEALVSLEHALDYIRRWRGTDTLVQALKHVERAKIGHVPEELVVEAIAQNEDGNCDDLRAFVETPNQLTRVTIGGQELDLTAQDLESPDDSSPSKFDAVKGLYGEGYAVTHVRYWHDVVDTEEEASGIDNGNDNDDSTSQASKNDDDSTQASENDDDRETVVVSKEEVGDLHEVLEPEAKDDIEDDKDHSEDEASSDDEEEKE